MLWCGYDDGRVASKSIKVSLCLFDFYVLKSLCFPMMLVLCYGLDEKGIMECYYEKELCLCVYKHAKCL